MKKTIATLSLFTVLISASAMDMAATSSMMGSKSHTMMKADMKKETDAEKATRFACSATAIDKRENMIITAADTNAAAVKSALTARRDGLKALYAAGRTEGHKDERKAIWSAFSSSTKSAMSDMRSSRKSAWATFETDMRACGVKNSNEKLEVISTPAAY